MTETAVKTLKARDAFLEKSGWRGASVSPLAGDASTRAYERLEQNGRRAVLMLAPPAAESAPCPPGARPEQRRTLGYNAMARLAGPNLHAFIEVATALRSAKLSAPEIYAADPEQGFAVIEDLGDDLYAREITKNGGEMRLYENAIDTLAIWHEAAITPPATPDYTLLDYDATALEAEAALFTEWYWPLKHEPGPSHDLQAEYLGLWHDLFKQLSRPHAIVLRDYHAENLLWLPKRKDTARTGIIDFQDALYGHRAYDLVSLLEDARRDVDPDLAQAMIERYCLAQNNTFSKDAFETDYAILAAQRNAKILGVFARLAKRDHKPRYLDLLPRIEAHFRNDLQRPGLEKMRQFITRRLPALGP